MGKYNILADKILNNNLAAVDWPETLRNEGNHAGPSSDDLLYGYFTTLHLRYRANSLCDAKVGITDMAQAAE